MPLATIKDMAKELNISPSTVSRALRDHPDISTKTKKKVCTLANDLDYQPDSIAQSLKNKGTKTIGVIVPEIRHHFFSSAISGIEDVTYEAGYTIIVSQSNESYEREVVNARALASHRIAGLLVSNSQNTKNADHYKLIQNRGIPLVFFDRCFDEIEATKVVVDDYEGAFKATEHLIDRGYKKIAHLAGIQSLSIGRDRFKGYKDALAKNNLPLIDQHIIFGGLTENEGSNGCRQLVECDYRPDAIFAVNDPVAIGAFITLKEKGMKIPDDMALIGFSNNPVSALIDPPLTTIAQPAYEMGREAAKLLVNQIATKNDITKVIRKVMKTQLIVRQST
jgi:DNA-binding LacI/PurR family transcriptional regulator